MVEKAYVISVLLKNVSGNCTKKSQASVREIVDKLNISSDPICLT